MKKINKNILTLLSLFVIALLSLFFKTSFVFGSRKILFSGINFIQPILAIPFIGSLFAFFLFFKYFIFSKFVTLGLPTLLSTLCWSISLKNKTNNSLFIEILNLILKVVLPVICIVLFILHPEGQKAYLYSFYWFIPISIYFFNKFKIYNSYFLTALATTFVAHAVGSIIWLYTIPMTSAQWILLIPVVAVERIGFACGINLTHILTKSIFKVNKAFFAFLNIKNITIN